MWVLDDCVRGRAPPQELGRALDIDAMELEELPTDHERAVAAEGQVTELQAELSVAKEALRKAGDAKRKAAERAAKKREKREEAKAAIRRRRR